MYDFSGRVVLITGGSGFLGAAAARAFAAAGAQLVLPDRQAGRLAARLADLAGERTLFADEVELNSAEAVERLVQQVLARFGRIDVLANTVGGYASGGPPHETPPEMWDAMHEANARIPFLVSRAVAPAMLAQGRGAIVNTGSRASLAGGAKDVAYSAAKSALARLTESFAAAYKGVITVNAVLPGTIDTPENREAMPKADPAKWVTPEAIARVILFLASDDATPISGALIPVYGRS